MDENVATRVTRSLRKRINSTESEPTLSRAGTPSRGGTPLRNLNLEAIAEDSPSKTRGRRRSVNVDTVETPSKVSARLSSVTETPTASPRRVTRRASFSQEDLKPATPVKGRRLSAVSSLQKPPATESPKRGRPKIIKDEAASVGANSPKRGRPKKEDSRSVTRSPSPRSIMTRSRSRSPNPTNDEVQKSKSAIKSSSKSKSPNLLNVVTRSSSRSPNPSTQEHSKTSPSFLTVVTRSSSRSPRPSTPQSKLSPCTMVLRSSSKSPNVLNKEDLNSSKELLNSSKEVLNSSKQVFNSSKEVLNISKEGLSTPKEVKENLTPLKGVKETITQLMEVKETLTPLKGVKETMTPLKEVKEISNSSKVSSPSKKENKEQAPEINRKVRVMIEKMDISKENVENSIDDRKSKSIQFIADDENDDRERTKYLKTPHISKNRSIMCDNSAENSFELLEISKPKSKADQSTESVKSEDIPGDLELKTPYRNKLINLSSSTPIGIAISTSKLELSLKEVSEEGMEVDKDVSMIAEEVEENQENIPQLIEENQELKMLEEKAVEDIINPIVTEEDKKVEDISETKTSENEKLIPEVSDSKKSDGDEPEKNENVQTTIPVVSENSTKPTESEVKENSNTPKEKFESPRKSKTPKKAESVKKAEIPFELFISQNNVKTPNEAKISPSKSPSKAKMSPSKSPSKAKMSPSKSPSKAKVENSVESTKTPVKELIEESKDKEEEVKEKNSPMEGKIPSEEPRIPEEIPVAEPDSSSWSASVRRSASSKIDKFESKPKEEVIKDTRPPKIPFIVDGNDEDEEEDKSSEDEKNSFLDDEAEEAGEEEDSMDEEEREYLAQNEIPEQGHSIGSEDSEEEDCEEEDDDSFIVADSDVEDELANGALQMVSDEDDLTDGTEKKKYKRIQRIESSDEEGKAENIDEGEAESKDNVETKAKAKTPRKSLGRRSLAPVEAMDVDEDEEEDETVKQDFKPEETFMKRDEKEALMINVTKFIDQDTDDEGKTESKESDDESDSEDDVISVSDSESEVDAKKSQRSEMSLRVSDSESGKDVKDKKKSLSSPMLLRVSDSESGKDVRKLDTSRKRLSVKSSNIDETSNEEALNSSQIKKDFNSSRKSKRVSSKAVPQNSSDEETENTVKNSSEEKEVNLNSSKMFMECLGNLKPVGSPARAKAKSHKKGSPSKAKSPSKRTSPQKKTSPPQDTSDSDKEELEALKSQGLLKKRYNKNNETLEDGELSEQENPKVIKSAKKSTYRDEMHSEKSLPKRFAQQVLHNSLNQSYGKYGGDSEELCTSEDDAEIVDNKSSYQKLSVSMSEELLTKKKKLSKTPLNKSHIGVTPASSNEEEENTQNVEEKTQKKKETQKIEILEQIIIKEHNLKKTNRKSMSALSQSQSDTKKARRRSLSGDRELSPSFVDHISKKKKKDKDNIENQTPEQSPEKSKEKEPRKFKDQEILGACDLYLEAANLAKRQAMLQNKKTLKDKIIQKKLDKKKKFHEEKEREEKRRVQENAIKKKKIKAIRKAAIAAASLLDQEVVITFKKPAKMITETDSRRLPEGILNALGENSQLKDVPQKKAKKVKIARTKSSTEEDDSPVKESRKLKKGAKFIKTAGGVFLEEPITPPKPKRKVLEIMKTRAGIVRVESMTPEKTTTDTSFHEEDKTPKAIGFKIRQILSAGQRGGIPKIEITKKSSKRKKALIDSEPSNLLPKPKWRRFEDGESSSALPKIVAKTSSTQFSVAKVNNNTLGVNMNALNFKQNALFNNDKIKRESAKEIIARKRKF